MRSDEISEVLASTHSNIFLYHHHYNLDDDILKKYMKIHMILITSDILSSNTLIIECYLYTVTYQPKNKSKYINIYNAFYWYFLTFSKRLLFIRPCLTKSNY